MYLILGFQHPFSAKGQICSKELKRRLSKGPYFLIPLEMVILDEKTMRCEEFNNSKLGTPSLLDKIQQHASKDW